MLTEERFAKILSILERMGSVTVQQLMTELDASESTVRRDLNTLDANGQLVKVHGGAILKNTVYSTIDDEVVHRKEQNREAKDKIARYAAGLITAEDFVYIDAGTTTERMIDYIANRQAVFVTNAIGHAKKLAEHGCKVYILGGEFKAVTEAIVGGVFPVEGGECLWEVRKPFLHWINTILRKASGEPMVSACRGDFPHRS